MFLADIAAMGLSSEAAEKAFKKRRIEQRIDTVCIYFLLLATFVGCAAVGWGLTHLFHAVLGELRLHEPYQHCDSPNDPNCGEGYVSTVVFTLVGWWAAYRAIDVVGGRRVSSGVSRALVKCLGKTDNVREFDPDELDELRLALQTNRVKIHKSV